MKSFLKTILGIGIVIALVLLYRPFIEDPLHGGKITDTETITDGQFGYNEETFYLLDENNYVKNEENKVICKDIKYLSEDLHMITTDNNLYGYNHIKNCKKVLGNFVLSLDNKLYRYDELTKRYVDDKIKDIQPIYNSANRPNENAVIAIYEDGSIKLYTYEELEENNNLNKCFNAFYKKLSFYQKNNIVKIHYAHDVYSDTAKVLFENGKLIRISIYIDRNEKITTEKEKIETNGKIKDFSVSYQYGYNYYLNENNEIYKDGEKILNAGKGIYSYKDFCIAIKEDNRASLIGNSSNNRFSIANIKELVYKGNTYAIDDNGIYYSLPSLDIINKDSINYQENVLYLNSYNEKAYIDENNKGYILKNDKVEHEIENVREVFIYNNTFFFVTLDDKIVSPNRFANTDITSIENVKLVEGNLILHTDGTITVLGSNQILINETKDLKDIKSIKQTNELYTLIDDNNKFYIIHSTIKNIKEDYDFQDNFTELLLVEKKSYSPQYVFLFKDTNDNLIRVCHLEENEIVDFGVKIIDNLGNYFLTETGYVINYNLKNNIETEQYGFKFKSE